MHGVQSETEAMSRPSIRGTSDSLFEGEPQEIDSSLSFGGVQTETNLESGDTIDTKAYKRGI